MDEPKRISVIMGIYNCSSTLVEALDSLYNQTYQNFKIILCDDCSTDNTFQVAQDYASKHDNIILIKNDKNLRLAATLNHCLEYADTEYVARMDGDDVSLNTRFEKEIIFLDTHPEYALVSCPMIYFDNNGDWGKGKSKETPQILDFVKGSPFCHAPVMMRRSALNNVGNYTVKSTLRRGQDYYLWHKFYVYGYKGFNLQEHLYKMRDDKMAAKRRTFRDRLNATRVRLEVYKHLGIPLKYYPTAFKGILVGLLPMKLYNILHHKM